MTTVAVYDPETLSCTGAETSNDFPPTQNRPGELAPRTQLTKAYTSMRSRLHNRGHGVTYNLDAPREAFRYLELDSNGVESFDLEHAVAFPPSKRMKNGEIKQWNEDHGNSLVCTRCSVLGFPCTHSVPCRPCEDADVICTFSKCAAANCTFGARCNDAHERC